MFSNGSKPARGVPDLDAPKLSVRRGIPDSEAAAAWQQFVEWSVVDASCARHMEIDHTAARGDVGGET